MIPFPMIIKLIMTKIKKDTDGDLIKDGILAFKVDVENRD